MYISYLGNLYKLYQLVDVSQKKFAEYHLINIVSSKHGNIVFKV